MRPRWLTAASERIISICGERKDALSQAFRMLSPSDLTQRIFASEAKIQRPLRSERPSVKSVPLPTFCTSGKYGRQRLCRSRGESDKPSQADNRQTWLPSHLSFSKTKSETIWAVRPSHKNNPPHLWGIFYFLLFPTFPEVFKIST